MAVRSWSSGPGMSPDVLNRLNLSVVRSSASKALAHSDLGAYLVEGDHPLDEIYEVPRSDSVAELPGPSGVN